MAKKTEIIEDIKFEAVPEVETTEAVEVAAPVLEEPIPSGTSIFFCKEYPNLALDIVSPSMDVINGKKVFYPGKEVRFSNHELVTDDVDAIKAIREHVWYGLKILEKGVDHSKIQKG